MNNGKVQPGCKTHEILPSVISKLMKNGIRDAIAELMSCNHIRSAEVFIETINSPCSHIAHRCSSFERFKQVPEIFFNNKNILKINTHLCSKRIPLYVYRENAFPAKAIILVVF